MSSNKTNLVKTAICSNTCKICKDNNRCCKNIFLFGQISNTELFMLNNSISKTKFNFNIQTGPIVTGSQYSCSEDFESLIDKAFYI